MNQVSLSQKKTVKGIGRIPCHLCHPLSIRVMCNTCQLYLASLDINKKQNHVSEQSCGSYDFNREKLRGRERIYV